MTICWFGIYDPAFGRNKTYIQALRKAGHTIIECRDGSKGLSKYWRLWKKHRLIKNEYDVMVVGYPGHLVVPFAKLISHKKVVADALGSLYDAEVNSHNPTFLRRVKSRIADRLMVKSADKILLESEAQKEFFEGRFGRSEKYAVVYTGVDEKFEKSAKVDQRVVSAEARKDESAKGDTFKVFFRGKLTPESGIMHILKAAESLRSNVAITFKIIGSGYLLEKAQKFIQDHSLLNVELVSRYLSDAELIKEIQDADLMLGQFEDNPRLNRTIPHKAFEAFAMGKAYLTGDAPGIREVAQDGVTAFFIPLADPKVLAQKIESLSKQPELLQSVAANGKRLFDERFSSAPLVEKLIKVML